MVGVAQLVERRTVAPNVVGSNPISHPKSSFPAKNLLDIVFLEDAIRREQNQLFRVRLSNQHPVERVSMTLRQPSSFDRVRESDVQRVNIHLA